MDINRKTIWKADQQQNVSHGPWISKPVHKWNVPAKPSMDAGKTFFGCMIPMSHVIILLAEWFSWPELWCIIIGSLIIYYFVK
jgi:hypothetical protein